MHAWLSVAAVDPLVSLMMVEKVPDSTYEMVGGLDKQIKEIKEVIELPVKHPELFEALGIAQPKVSRPTHKGVLAPDSRECRTLHRECCCTGRRGRGRRCWRGPLLTTQSARLSACRAPNWSRSTSAKVRAWCASCSSWRGMLRARFHWAPLVGSDGILGQRACAIYNLHGRDRLDWVDPDGKRRGRWRQ